MVSFGFVDPDRVPTFKMVVHGVQILLIFVMWCLEINIFVDKKAKITGQNGWTFGAVRVSSHPPKCFEPTPLLDSSSQGATEPYPSETTTTDVYSSELSAS